MEIQAGAMLLNTQASRNPLSTLAASYYFLDYLVAGVLSVKANRNDIGLSPTVCCPSTARFFA
jgi:hypothetical protein